MRRSRSTRWGSWTASAAPLLWLLAVSTAQARPGSADFPASGTDAGSPTPAAASGSSDASHTPLESGVDSTFAPEPAGAELKPRMDIYGFAMLDMGYDFKQVDPDWFDVLRPTKLPSSPNQFGEDGNFYAGVRQSRLGVKGYMPTSLGEIKTIFEFELFGTGVDAGQTTFRLRHAWGELGCFGAGQTWSPFMDPDVFPNSLEYWGPNGMVFFRNVQVRYMPLRGNHELFIALERPGASADQGLLADRIKLEGVKGHFPAPDFSAHYKESGDWGHVQLAGMLRYIGWIDTVQNQFNLSGHKIGWGVNLSTNIKTPMNGTVRASVVWGHGIENYMNDAPVDIGAQTNLINPVTPITGRALPVLGIVGFYDFNWSDRFTSAIGYSRVEITNSNGQDPNAYHIGQYALTNLLYYPVKNLMAGLEFQWGRRENFRDGFSVSDYRLQFSAKYNFNFHLGGPNP